MLLLSLSFAVSAVLLVVLLNDAVVDVGGAAAVGLFVALLVVVLL